MVLFDKSGCVLAAFLSVTIHETAHIFAMKIFGAEIKSVSFEPFGIIMKKERNELNNSQSVIVALAGCGANVFLAVTFYALFLVFKVKYFSVFSQVNILLFALNILPVNNLDGGDVLKIFLIQRMSEKKAVNICRAVSLAICGFIFLLGIIICVKGKFNPSLIILAVYLSVTSFKMNRD